ncbi:hypothetical protein BG011_004731 [Mortierella polycephala]|uniref:Uncharacterized protein n=1 Tax=Mortierella polycephala TaxID=41804 RepID=A0A9P6U2B0_9FUNG|nr:hypothetical protein BG011_004731 [Mortierella polycephala]
MAPASDASFPDGSYAWMYRRAIAVVGGNGKDTPLSPDHDTEPGQESTAQEDKVISDINDNKDSNKDSTNNSTHETVTGGIDDDETANKQEEEERKATEEADRKAAEEEAAKKEKEEADRKAKEEAERKAKEEAEMKAKEEAERIEREEAEQRAKGEAEQKAKDEADQKAREEREQREREEREEQARKKAQEEAEARDKSQREELERQEEKDHERIKAENAAEEQRRKEEIERESSRNNQNESTDRLDGNSFSHKKGPDLPIALVVSISAGAVVLASIVAALLFMYKRQAHRRSNALDAFLCRKVELYPIRDASGSISHKGSASSGTTNDHSFYGEEIALSMAQQPPSHQSPLHRHAQTYRGDDLLLVHSNDNSWATPMPPLAPAPVSLRFSVDVPRSHHNLQRQQHAHGQYMEMSPEMASYNLPVHLQDRYYQNQKQSHHIQDGYTMEPPPPPFHAYYEHPPIESTLIASVPEGPETPSEPTSATLPSPPGNPRATALLSETLDPIMHPRLPQGFGNSISQDGFGSPRRTISLLDRHHAPGADPVPPRAMARPAVIASLIAFERSNTSTRRSGSVLFE